MFFFSSSYRFFFQWGFSSFIFSCLVFFLFSSCVNITETFKTYTHFIMSLLMWGNAFLSLLFSFNLSTISYVIGGRILMWRNVNKFFNLKSTLKVFLRPFLSPFILKLVLVCSFFLICLGVFVQKAWELSSSIKFVKINPYLKSLFLR